MKTQTDKGVIDKLKELKSFYTDHLKNTMLPFWLERAPDTEYGGFFTCFSPDGSKLITTDKFTWSQGRVAWLFAKLAATSALIFSDDERKQFMDISKLAVDYMVRYAIGPDGGYFLTKQDGTPKEYAPKMGLCPSSFTDVFIVLGLSGYAAASKDPKLLDMAFKHFYNVEQKVSDHSFRTAPYIIDPDMCLASGSMSIVQLTTELHRACIALGDSRAESLKPFAVKHCDRIFNNFRQPDGVILEQIKKDLIPAESFLGRFINPGHSTEMGWFILENCVIRNDDTGVSEAVNIIEKALEIGKDQDYGGILYYVDRDGGQPRGQIITEADAKAKEAYDRDWSNKLWWPHTETLYALMLAYAHTKKSSLLDEFDKLHEYTFKTFPNPDKTVGEWIQLRDREGQPILDNVGGRLPVKDPYHAIRNFIMLIELLDSLSD